MTVTDKPFLTREENTQEPEPCSICYEPMGDVDFCVTKCNHRFHTSCILQAIKFNGNCPYCRTCLDKSADPAVALENQQNIADMTASRNLARTNLIQALIDLDMPDITVSDISFSSDEILEFQPVRSRLAERRTTSNRNCGICGQQGHDRRRCINRAAFVE